jgi:hypothetical protein
MTRFYKVMERVARRDTFGKHVARLEAEKDGAEDERVI